MITESNKELEEYETRMRSLNYSEWEILLDLSQKWTELCPDDPNGEQLAVLTYRARVIYKKVYLWCDEFDAILERTAVRLLRRLSDQMNMDGLNRAWFRQNPEEL